MYIHGDSKLNFFSMIIGLIDCHHRCKTGNNQEQNFQATKLGDLTVPHEDFDGPRSVSGEDPNAQFPDKLLQEFLQGK